MMDNDYIIESNSGDSSTSQWPLLFARVDQLFSQSSIKHSLINIIQLKSTNQCDVNQLVCQSINQKVKQSFNQSINQYILCSHSCNCFACSSRDKTKPPENLPSTYWWWVQVKYESLVWGWYKAGHASLLVSHSHYSGCHPASTGTWKDLHRHWFQLDGRLNACPDLRRLQRLRRARIQRFECRRVHRLYVATYLLRISVHCI